MKNNFKILILYILSCIFSVAPMVIYICLNSEKYIKTLPQSIKLCFGGALVLFLIILKIFGKLHINSRFTFFIILFALSYLLNSILSDLLIFSSLAMLGEVFDMIISIPIRKLNEKRKTEGTANATAQKIEEILKKHYRGQGIS